MAVDAQLIRLGGRIDKELEYFAPLVGVETQKGVHMRGVLVGLLENHEQSLCQGVCVEEAGTET